MKKFFQPLLLLITLFVLASANIGQTAVKDLKPTVILISLDGFRYDYLEKYQPRVLNQLAKEGVRAKWMTPSFPSKTFPNHYTIVTGLYPAHHGIVENNVYDYGEVFGMDKTKEVQNSRWWFGEPIWVTAEKQGQIAASYFWVGTEAAIENTRPKCGSIKHWRGSICPRKNGRR
jgi:predicted AlkP superfamily pyrophosphatase or phosphodiesterase